MYYEVEGRSNNPQERGENNFTENYSAMVGHYRVIYK
jgi:hypothetical protein